MNGDICTWHREIDINPPGLPDAGKLSRKTPAFILEEGVFQPYVEEWERIDDGGAGRIVLRRERALLVQVGRHVLRATPTAVDYWLAASSCVERSTDTSRVGLPVQFSCHDGAIVENGAHHWQVTETTVAHPLGLLTGETV